MRRKLLFVLLAFLLVTGVACTKNQAPAEVAKEDTEADEIKEEKDSNEEMADGTLVSEGMMDIEYATQFTIEKFKGGYRLVRNIFMDEPVLVVPEGKPVPENLEEGTQIIQLPVTKSYLAGSNMVAMADGIGAIEKVTVVGQDVDWHFQSINDQLESGHTVFAGQGDKADYELIGTSEPQFAVDQSSHEKHFDKFRLFEIPLVAEENTAEPNLFARMEWMRCLGVLYGIEEQADAYYNDQKSKIEAIIKGGETGLMVGMGAKSATSGKFSTRKSGDFRADYIRYAGGKYNLEGFESDKGGPATLTDEDFYTKFKDCDILIWSQRIPNDGTMEDLIELYPPIVDFRAYQNNKIYVQARKFIQMGARNPADVVTDIHNILISEEPITTEFIIHVPKN